jgi:hypothetical protein
MSLALGQAGVGILALTPELATLEDLFFRLTEGAESPAGDGPAATTTTSAGTTGRREQGAPA